MSVNDRHSFKPRSPQDHSHDAQHHHSLHHGGVHLERDKAEELAEKMMTVGGEYIAAKTEARYSEDELPQGPSAVATGPDPEALTNKIIKEAAREMERAEGHVFAGSDASLAQKVAYARHDPQAPEYVVVEKIKERLTAAEDHAVHHTVQGPNPEKGVDRPNEKLRHHRGASNEPYITGGFKNERNPDVSEPRR